jgi:hypothetical protein
MSEWRLFDPEVVPECATPGWYAGREHAPHLDQDAHRPRLEMAALKATDISDALGLTTLVDLGAGDGGLLSLLPPRIRAWGYDLQPTNVAAAYRRNADVRYADVLHDNVAWGEIAVATEIIEHLVDPAGFLRLVADNARVIVASSPGTETDQGHYEHHLWAWDMAGYRALFERSGWVVVDHTPCGAFQVLVAEVKG